MKTAKKTAIIFAICFIFFGLVLCAASLAAMGGILNMSTVKYSKNEYEITENFKNIDIDEIECDVIFLPAKDGKCKVEATESEKIISEIDVVGDTLTVTRKDKRAWYEKIGFIWWGDMTLKVYLPEREYGELVLKTVSGDIDLRESFTFGSASVTSTSGNIKFFCSAEDGLQIETTSGDIRLQGSSAGADTKIKTVSGDITLASVTARSLTLGTTSGDIEADNVLITGKIHAKTVSGDVDFGASDAAVLEIKTTSGDVKCALLSPKNIRAHSTSGDIRLPEYVPASGSCEINTMSGDIKVTYN
ncbi:MAG: DUF4097 family beta strand repeat protein [Clostridia bacterium]|nr:DUF4097 family beta strand repeat protein [Clostridia bacterium]